MDNIDYDYEIEKQYHPENFEYISVQEVEELSNEKCPNDGNYLYEYPQANGPDDYVMVFYCKSCDFKIES